MVEDNLEYIKPTNQIFNTIITEKLVDWRSYLYNLIERENMDPWDIDLLAFTKIYLKSFNGLKNIDFNQTGKFLTIAVHLLKMKTKNLITKDIQGYEQRISELEDNIEDFEDLEHLDGFLDEVDSIEKKREKYKINFRNPLARKRKVTLTDLIQVLEKTIKDSDVRLTNFFQKKEDTNEYNGPDYTKDKKDIKQIIEELYSEILESFSDDSKKHILFSEISEDISTKMDILNKFIPLLHLHNQEKLELSQEEHLGDIKIKRVEEVGIVEEE